MRLLRDTWRRTTLQRCEQTRSAAVNLWNGFRRRDGESPKTLPARRCTCVPRRAIMCTGMCWQWTAAGWGAEGKKSDSLVIDVFTPCREDYITGILIFRFHYHYWRTIESYGKEILSRTMDHSRALHTPGTGHAAD